MTTVKRVTRSFLTLALLAAGCEGSLPAPCEDGSCGRQAWSQGTFQVDIDRRVDVLFVVDDTAAMAPHAGALATGMADMGRRLREADPRISLHVGVVRAGTCDASTRGAACGVAAPEQFLRSEWCDTITNYNAATDFGDAVACLADLGAGNCGPAQPVAAAVQALAGAPRAGW